MPETPLPLHDRHPFDPNHGERKKYSKSDMGSHIFAQTTLLPFLTALLCVGIAHPTMVRIAHLKDIVDVPDARKLQRTPIPIMGGICVFLGGITGIGISSFFEANADLFVVVMAMTVMLYTGTIDDILGLSPRIRLVIEILTVLCLIGIGGYVLNDFHGLWGVGIIPMWAAVPLTVFAAVGIINAINLIDGVDGLSSGFCIMACVMFGWLFYLAGDTSMTILAAVSAGALVPFFLHNVYGKTSKMFIGDGGTLVLGTVISIFVIRILQNGMPCEHYVGRNMGLIPFTLAVLAFPVFDTLRVMCARILRGVSPFLPDKTHLHHLFISLGFSHAGTTVVILTLNLLVVLAWWAAYAAGASIDLQLYLVLLLGVLITTGIYYPLRRLNPSGHAFRRLRRLGRLSHIERTGPVLWLQRLIDRM